MGAGPEQWDDVERVGAELGGEAIRLWASIRIYIYIAPLRYGCRIL